MGFLRFLLFFSFLQFSCHFSYAQYALEFEGGTDYVALNGNDIAPPWSMEVTAKKTETDNYQHLLTGTDGNSGIRLEQYWGTKIGFTKSGVADWYFNYTAPLNEWIQIGMTNDGSVTRLYINGNYIGSVNTSINFPLKWISKNTDFASLKAIIDELRIWDVVLTAEEIAQYAGQEVDSTHPEWDHLLHYYKFDEGSGNVCYDSKGGLNGIIHGASYYTETDHDIGIKELVAPASTSDNYSDNEPLIIKIKNYGNQEITEPFSVSYTLDGVLKETVTVSDTLQPGEKRDIAFSSVNMEETGTYDYVFYTQLPGDENLSNDTLKVTLYSNSHVLGAITAFQADSNTALISSGVTKIKVIFYKDDLFRIWLAPTGYFTDPAGDQIIVENNYPVKDITWSDEGAYYLLSTEKVCLRVNKVPVLFSLYKADNQTLIWKERKGLDYGTRTFQYLETSPDEYFYGGGMQNGYFSHKGTKIDISLQTQNWDDGAVPNPVPFYMSTKGYGAFRNTFAKGEYDFRSDSAISLSHQENRFDCYYFVGDGLKDVLDGYTGLTGRPFLPPRWGLELGDADCYNKDGHTTPEVIELVADKYRAYDLPGGWILPNDGYGCGYTDLEYVVEQLHDRGFYTGLWTENGVDQIAWEVGTAGTRLCKLDVAWVGSGYQNALNACEQAYNGIEENCNERGYVWSVCGWAGTQRYSVVWSGDQSGGFEYIRFHIPTLIGSGLSGYSLASSDLDGIFGGSALSYARDIQWKTFIPVYYAMSGWAPSDKHPWNYGTTVTDISRKYLKLKQRLLPYLYDACHTAHVTGLPVVRAMVLEYPDDPVTFDKTTQYQFMSGKWLLVAPVYKNEYKRDSIYFPQGRFVDYWNGDVYQGPMFLNGYETPLDKCPVFVREGAIIPMYSERLYDSQYPKDTIFYDIYPGGNSSYTFYEDDGVSRDYREGFYSETEITCEAPDYGQTGLVVIHVGASEGFYMGKPATRVNRFEVHVGYYPDGVFLDDQPLQSFNSLEQLEDAEEGWYYSPADRKGVLHVKTKKMSTQQPFELKIDITTGKKKVMIDNNIMFYPNPVSDQLTVAADNRSIVAIRIFDMEGRLLLHKQDIKSDKVFLDLQDLDEGMYLIETVTDYGRATGKFTKL